MAERIQKTKPEPRKQEDEPLFEPVIQPADHTETDDLLAEIDDLLDDVIGESSAQEFMNAYVQKGGQ